MRTAEPEPERMTDAFRTRLGAVSSTVKTVGPMNDIEIFCEDEYWTYPRRGFGAGQLMARVICGCRQSAIAMVCALQS